jgi:hypothetical protein
VLVQLRTSLAVPARGDPVARTAELEASARDLPAVVEPRRRSQPKRRGREDRHLRRGREDRHLKFYATQDNLSKTTALRAADGA